MMTNIELANKLKDIAKNYKTLYVMGCFGAPMTPANKKRYTQNHSYNRQVDRTAMINAASTDTFGFDCVCLIKGVLWGWRGDKNAIYGGATYTSNGVPDIGADSMIKVCKNVTTVAYIRVSTEKDAQLHSYDFQEHYWRSAFVNDPEIELTGIYADKGISGHSVQKRPQFLLMMQDARDHKFDKIYTKSVSRFARNTTQLLEAVRELRDIGIEVVFEKENIHTFEPTSEVFLTIAATIAENDLDVDSERMRWSVRHRFENGWISIGSGLYGLRLTADNELEIVPEEAAVVRYIYDAYVNEGLGCKKIADALNAAGVKKPSGYPWNAKHIVGLIRNEKYKGDVIMGKSVSHLGEYHKNPNGEYAPRYYMEDTHEAIVDKATWEAAQRIMDERGRNHVRERPVYPFTGLVECGLCGKKYVHKVNNSCFKWRTDIWA